MMNVEGKLGMQCDNEDEAPKPEQKPKQICGLEI
jgi:hypothetical protein